jgi:hypothetical protein
MSKRTSADLQQLLENLMNCDHVYYQPPSNIQMMYPAICFSRNDIDNRFANNSVYAQQHSYEIIVIDKNPESEIVEKVSKLPRVRFERHYVADNLNHDVFELYI